jgi:hypothetical protein
MEISKPPITNLTLPGLYRGFGRFDFVRRIAAGLHAGKPGGGTNGTERTMERGNHHGMLPVRDCRLARALK